MQFTLIKGNTVQQEWKNQEVCIMTTFCLIARHVFTKLLSFLTFEAKYCFKVSMQLYLNSGLFSTKKLGLNCIYVHS